MNITRLSKKIRAIPTRLEDVVGCLKYTGKPKTISQMNQGIVLQIKKRHASGRY